MGRRTFKLPEAQGELALSVLLGVAFALALFVLMALAQMMGGVEPPKSELDEMLVAYVPPDIEEIEEEEVIEEEEPEEEPIELEEEPPQLSLEQLDIALNPGTGGALVGDFSMPSIGTSQKDLGTEDFVDFADLDQVPRPVGVSGLNFPRRLKRRKVSGRIVVILKLNEKGEVLDVQLDSSTLPEFNDHVLGEVRRWRFTPPTQQGRPVRAQARLPIPININ